MVAFILVLVRNSLFHKLSLVTRIEVFLWPSRYSKHTWAAHRCEWSVESLLGFFCALPYKHTHHSPCHHQRSVCPSKDKGAGRAIQTCFPFKDEGQGVWIPLKYLYRENKIVTKKTGPFLQLRYYSAFQTNNSPALCYFLFIKWVCLRLKIAF